MMRGFTIFINIILLINDEVVQGKIGSKNAN
jgi:hypothetical protein